MTSKQVVGGGYHRPVCVRCQCEMQPETNGVGLLDMVDFGPYAVWAADEWKCPKCGYKVVGGFGVNPISRHHDSDFTEVVQCYRKANKLRINNG